MDNSVFRLYRFAIGLLLTCGFGLLLTPWIGNSISSYVYNDRIEQYIYTVEKMDSDMPQHLLAKAASYNRLLLEEPGDHDVTQDAYNLILDIDGSDMIGYLAIPAISLSLPIYHGTSDYAMEHGVGHLKWSSFPVGGQSSHCVLSGHSGLPSAKLFSDLDRLALGDLFMIYVLNEVLIYEVDQILVVMPDETDELLIQKNMDLCTLVTCTPYGINSHRLLVRGHRVNDVN